MKKKIHLMLMLYPEEIYEIVKDEYPILFAERDWLLKQQSQEFYNHPLASHGELGLNFDRNSSLCLAVIEFWKTGKSSKKLKEYARDFIEWRIKKTKEEENKNKEESQSEGYIYLIRCKNRYKIGRSKSAKRTDYIISHIPFKTKLLFQKKVKNYKEVERSLHKAFKKKRIKGEWFKLKDEDIQKILKLSV